MTNTSNSLLLLQISFALIVGLLMTRAFKYLHINLPDVTAFLLAGILIGPHVLGTLDIEGLGFISDEEVKYLSIISEVALGFIAFDIGNEFRLSELKQIGKKAMFIGILQAVVTTLVVDAVMMLLAIKTNEEIITIPSAIILGSIAAATAPAATLMVVRQYKAKVKITDLLLPIVALDDAVGLVVFAISFGIAQALISSKLTLSAILLEPLLEIILSLVLGAILGFVLTLLERLYFSNQNRVALSIAFVMLSITLAQQEFKIGTINISFSTLLVNMMLGTVLCNLYNQSDAVMERCEKWTTPLYALFFVLSGAELRLDIFKNDMMVLIGVVYILTRSFGKYLGAYTSSKIVGCDKTTSKYLGITLLPQAGVALGMCNTAASLGTNGEVIRNIVLFGVMVYEIIGPGLTRTALMKAGEIATPKEVELKKRRKRFRFAH